ncbi:transcriptional repressor [Actinorhabdospora filicis]|uniref:Transcriptional repressor n=1 Tax=Actinorhabdospora filicis TaxID=1785913 RepID=A0A9W6STZ8_9ACTN|nr:transcriptional repressor [Actinorhabdospora filicis]
MKNVQSERLLRSHGLRVTRQRLAVLDVLQEGGHPEVDEIITRARRRVSSLSTQAAYDVLAALTDAGLARRIEPAGSHARYEARVNDSHHHLVCRSCGEVLDVEISGEETPCLEPAMARGFMVEEAEVTFWGICPRCQAARS